MDIATEPFLQAHNNPGQDASSSSNTQTGESPSTTASRITPGPLQAERAQHHHTGNNAVTNCMEQPGNGYNNPNYRSSISTPSSCDPGYCGSETVTPRPGLPLQSNGVNGVNGVVPTHLEYFHPEPLHTTVGGAPVDNPHDENDINTEPKELVDVNMNSVVP